VLSDRKIKKVHRNWANSNIDNMIVVKTETSILNKDTGFNAIRVEPKDTALYATEPWFKYATLIVGVYDPIESPKELCELQKKNSTATYSYPAKPTYYLVEQTQRDGDYRIPMKNRQSIWFTSGNYDLGAKKFAIIIYFDVMSIIICLSSSKFYI
jgi:hypothetical protein